MRMRLATTMDTIWSVTTGGTGSANYWSTVSCSLADCGIEDVGVSVRSPWSHPFFSKFRTKVEARRIRHTQTKVKGQKPPKIDGTVSEPALGLHL